MNHLAVGVKSAMHANSLAFELLHLVLMVDVVRGAAVGILEHILVTRLHDDTREDLDSGLLGLGIGNRVPVVLIGLASVLVAAAVVRILARAAEMDTVVATTAPDAHRAERSRASSQMPAQARQETAKSVSGFFRS